MVSSSDDDRELILDAAAAIVTVHVREPDGSCGGAAHSGSA
jgi:hypothetical protein